MGPKAFIPPKDQEELELRAKDVTADAAHAMLGALRPQRANLVKSIDVEIKFYEDVLKLKGEEV